MTLPCFLCNQHLASMRLKYSMVGAVKPICDKCRDFSLIAVEPLGAAMARDKDPAMVELGHKGAAAQQRDSEYFRHLAGLRKQHHGGCQARVVAAVQGE